MSPNISEQFLKIFLSYRNKCTWSETVVGLEEGEGLSTGRRCSLNLSLSRRFVSPMYSFTWYTADIETNS